MIFFFVLTVVLSGCARVPNADSSGINKWVEPRIGRRVSWYQGGEEDTQFEKRRASLLEQELSLDAVVQISLLSSRSLLALYEEIGISQADVVQAGLVSNPLLSATVGFPTQSGAVVSTQFSIAQNFIDFFSLSLRKKYASIQYEQTELKIANSVLDHVAAVESAYYTVQAQICKTELLSAIVEIESSATELAQRQLEAGNIYQMQVAVHQKRCFEAKIALAKSQSHVLVLREKLNQLMGLLGSETDWKITPILADLPSVEVSLEDVEAHALRNRLDLKAAQKEVELMAQALGLQEWWTYTQGQIGIVQARDSEGIPTLGPTLSFALPIFDCGQAARAKTAAKLRQSYEHMMALVTTIRAEVRAARQTLIVSRELASYQFHVVTPLQIATMQLSQNLYNAMSIGVYELLNVRRDEILSKIEYIEALKEYWLARVELGRQIGAGF